MPCLKCKKKGIPIPCKYCNLSFCSRCIQLEIHNCSGSDIKKQDSLEITTLIQDDKTNEFNDFASELLIQNDPVEVVSALLSKLAQNDSSKKIEEDKYVYLNGIKLLAEDDRMKTRVFEDYSNLHAIEKADFLSKITFGFIFE